MGQRLISCFSCGIDGRSCLGESEQRNQTDIRGLSGWGMQERPRPRWNLPRGNGQGLPSIGMHEVTGLTSLPKSISCGSKSTLGRGSSEQSMARTVYGSHSRGSSGQNLLTEQQYVRFEVQGGAVLVARIEDLRFCKGFWRVRPSYNVLNSRCANTVRFKES